jgi:TonB family protein
MKTSLLFLTLFIAINVSGQRDTIVYYKKLGATTENKEEAAGYTEVSKKTKNNYLVSYYDKVNGKWIKNFTEKYKRIADSAFQIGSDTKNFRYFQKTDSGYLIKDYNNSILKYDGKSKLIFPLIQFGDCRSYFVSTGKIRNEAKYINNQMISNRYWINEKDFIDDVFFNADTIAKYEGGEKELMKFIYDNIVYPEPARVNNIQGKVQVGFIIMTDGSIKGVHLLKGVHYYLDQEALRIVKLVPNKWTPALIGGKKVNMAFNVPVTFQLKNPMQ